MTQIAPYIGYLASLFLIFSLIVKNDIKFRLYNTLGCICFIIYGVIFNAFPVILTNAILLVINVYYLLQLYKHKENFELVEFAGEDKMMEKFIQFYKDDIAIYFPSFDATELKSNVNFVVLRDLVVANIFSVAVAENGDATVAVNYTTKKYRDFKVGKFIFEKGKQFLIDKGVKKIIYKKDANTNHATFLKVNGFEENTDAFFKHL
jgi:Bacterial inner membrane protein